MKRGAILRAELFCMAADCSAFSLPPCFMSGNRCYGIDISSQHSRAFMGNQTSTRRYLTSRYRECTESQIVQQ